MTREQARNLLRNSKPKDNNAYSLMLNGALDMAIEALEQESCEDCISREQTICKLRADTTFLCTGDKIQAIKDIEQMSPITVQQKTGQWINIDETHSKCDRCEAVFEISSKNGEVNYCPNCGARMVELQEKEV